MLFTSFHFITFFTVTWVLWFFIRPARRITLFVAGLIFICSFSWVSALLCLFLSLVNFWSAKLLETHAQRRLYFLLQVLNIFLIPVGNYLSTHALFFGWENTQEPGHFLLTVGLSFYGLQHYAYLNDVMHRRYPAEKNLLLFLLASTYFLKFLSGPLTMYKVLKDSLVHQETAVVKPFPGLNRILVGYFKKMVIADALAPSVSSVFDYGDALPGLTILGAAFIFTLQLYFDFSGYCDIAIGCSSLFGIRLPENFDLPLRASSMTRFWRRWHITLLAFFTTYVFYPLSFFLRRWGRHAAAIGITAVFVMSSAWHGFGATFFVWGLCHAFFVLTEHYLFPRQNESSSLKKVSGNIMVLLLFSFSNIFFRSISWQSCQGILVQLFTVRNFLPGEWSVEFLSPLAVGGHQIDLFNFYVLLLVTTLFLLLEERIIAYTKQEYFRPVPSFLLLLLIFVFGIFASGQRFIYMQF